MKRFWGVSVTVVALVGGERPLRVCACTKASAMLELSFNNIIHLPAVFSIFRGQVPHKSLFLLLTLLFFHLAGPIHIPRRLSTPSFTYSSCLQVVDPEMNIKSFVVSLFVIALTASVNAAPVAHPGHQLSHQAPRQFFISRHLCTRTLLTSNQI